MAVAGATTELAQSYEVGLVQTTPFPDTDVGQKHILEVLARHAWSLTRVRDTTIETSHAFVLPPGLNENVTGLLHAEAANDLKSTRRQINEAAFALYGIRAEDRSAIEASSKVARSSSAREEEGNADETTEDEALSSLPEGTLSNRG